MLKCRPSVSTQANRRHRHWSTVSSTAHCSSPHHAGW